jgi:predicted lipoprotein with Yx(FWY)xxD motif
MVSLATISGIPDQALVGSNGRTLYLFEADKNGTSACSGACARAWPPDTVTGAPDAGSGVSQALLGIIKRPDGIMQVTYHGHPLYYFIGDNGAGAAKGQGLKAFGAGWYVVSASGSKIDTS